MRRHLLCSAGLAGILALCLAAAPRPFDDVMKEIGPACGSLKKNLDAGSADLALKDAQQLQKLFKETRQFWAKRKTQDAVGFASTGETALKDIVKATKGGDVAAAKAPFEALLGTCKSCHGTHREKGPDGKWKIKGA